GSGSSLAGVSVGTLRGSGFSLTGRSLHGIYRRFEAGGEPCFITTNISERRHILVRADVCQTLVDILYNVRQEEQILLLAFAIMPDHLHVIFVPNGTPSRAMQLIKGRFARFYNQRAQRRGVLWQTRYHERTLWTEEALNRAIGYIHNNPIVAGLAEAPEQYRWSSANEVYATDLEVYLGGQAKA
ncbi:MAG: transposase, partial [Dehalococcoidia bacterium]